jgi:hypothetical protein
MTEAAFDHRPFRDNNKHFLEGYGMHRPEASGLIIGEELMEQRNGGEDSSVAHRDCGSSENGNLNRNNGQPQDADPAGHKASRTFRIEPEPAEPINVGAGGKLIVPREDIGEGIGPETELDLIGPQRLKIRKPGRREWIALDPASELPTRLLIHRPKVDGIEVEYYYVVPELRGAIVDELKMVRVFLCYSFTSRSHFLWPVNVTIDNSWYDSLLSLFGMPREFFGSNAIRVVPDKDKSRYRIRVKPIPTIPTWLGRATDDLLGEALGADRFINSVDHPLYRDLVEGQELD